MFSKTTQDNLNRDDVVSAMRILTPQPPRIELRINARLGWYWCKECGRYARYYYGRQ